MAAAVSQQSLSFLRRVLCGGGGGSSGNARSCEQSNGEVSGVYGILSNLVIADQERDGGVQPDLEKEAAVVGRIDNILQRRLHVPHAAP